MAELEGRIAAVLGPHTAVGEAGLFPALAADFPWHVAVLTVQHRVIEQVLGEGDGGLPANLVWPDRLIEVLHLLREHIPAEQDGVFPTALGHLDTAGWDAIEDVRRRAGTGLAEHPH